MPDYDAFISKLGLNSSQQSLPDSQQSLPDSGHSSDHPTFTSSPSYLRLQQETRAWLRKNIELICRAYPPESEAAPTSRREQSRKDNSIYIGSGGNAYLHWRLARFFEAEGEAEKVAFHRKCALTAINVALSMMPKKFHMGDDISFYIGSAGRCNHKIKYRKSGNFHFFAFVIFMVFFSFFVLEANVLVPKIFIVM